MTRASTVLFVVAMTGLSGSLAPQASAAEPVDDHRAHTVRIHPGKLSKGPSTTHARLVRNTIRDGRFRKRVRVLAPYEHAGMLGKARKGYIVSGYSKRRGSSLWYVPRRGPAKRLRSGRNEVYQISPSGRYAAVTNIGGKRDRLRIRTIPGDKTIATHTAEWIVVLDMRGPRALLDLASRRRERVAWLRPRDNRLRPVIRRAGWWASARHNRLLTDEPAAKGGFAMVRLDNPRKVLWRRGMRGLAPSGISPDGKYLMSAIWSRSGGLPGDRIGLEFRRMSDGRVVRRFRAHRFDSDLAWVGRHKFLVAVAGKAKTSMVRCRVDGRCVRVGRSVPTLSGMSPEETLGVSLGTRTAHARADRSYVPRLGLPSPPTS